MPTPAEYDMLEAHLPGTEGYIEVSVDRIQRKAARLKTERAKGPAGDYNEHMAPYGRKHPRGSPEEAAVEDFAFFVDEWQLDIVVAEPHGSGDAYSGDSRAWNVDGNGLNTEPGPRGPTCLAPRYNGDGWNDRRVTGRSGTRTCLARPAKTI